MKNQMLNLKHRITMKCRLLLDSHQSAKQNHVDVIVIFLFFGSWRLTAQWCGQFFSEYNSKLLESPNYITRRQAAKVKCLILLKKNCSLRTNLFVL